MVVACNRRQMRTAFLQTFLVLVTYPPMLSVWRLQRQQQFLLETSTDLRDP